MKVESDLDENELCLVAGSCFEQNQDSWNLFHKGWREAAQPDNDFLVGKKKRWKFLHNNMGLVTAQLVKHSSTNPPSVQQVLSQH